MSSYSKKEITISEARKYAENIAENLGLKPQIKKEIIEQVGKMVLRFISTHEDESKMIYFID